MIMAQDPLSATTTKDGDDLLVDVEDSNANSSNNGSEHDSPTSNKRDSLVVGVAERNGKTGVNLSLASSPVHHPTSLTLDLDFSNSFKKVELKNNSPSFSQPPSHNGSICSDQVFVDAAAAALRAKGPPLSGPEEECTKEFLEIVNGARLSKGVSPLSWNAGVKFLMARKFNVRRALELYNQHQISRHEEGLFDFNPEAEPLKSELISGKFTVLPVRDLGGAAIAVFTARSHVPSVSPHETTLKGVVYQLDAALEDAQTQRCGLIFIYDMTDSKYSNFDYELSAKILSLLKGSYPARLKKVLIVTAPLWFRAPFKILRLFVREKLRDRVFTVSVPQLGVHIPSNSLPRSLGGQLEVNHEAWLSICNQIMNSSDLWGSFAEDTIPCVDHISDGNENPLDEHKNLAGEFVDKERKKMRRNGQSTPSPTPNSSGSSGFSDDDSLPFEEKTGLTLPEFVEHLKQKGRRGLLDEYAEIVSKSPEGSFNASRLRGNVNKNRYSDVLCFDHTRVVLTSETEIVSEVPCDYINANYVDGYKQRNAFISTQGPLPRTFGDFWKMVWEQAVVLIVMTTRAVERGRTKCGQYWPPDADSSVTHEGFKLKNLEVDMRPDFALTRLQITNVKTNETREVSHLQFLSWPDYGVPSSGASTLKFLQIMRDEQASRVQQLASKWDGHPLGPPIVVHCSAGIGRTGTLCTMDICIKRLLDQGTINVMRTVERIRSQRAYSIQVPEQYLFCHAAMIEYALANGLLTQVQVEEVPDLLAEGPDLQEEREREKAIGFPLPSINPLQNCDAQDCLLNSSNPEGRKSSFDYEAPCAQPKPSDARSSSQKSTAPTIADPSTPTPPLSVAAQLMKALEESTKASTTLKAKTATKPVPIQPHKLLLPNPKNILKNFPHPHLPTNSTNPTPNPTPILTPQVEPQSDTTEGPEDNSIAAQPLQPPNPSDPHKNAVQKIMQHLQPHSPQTNTKSAPKPGVKSKTIKDKKPSIKKS